MQIIKITKTNATLTPSQFFDLHPTVQLPQPITNNALEPYGAVLVEDESTVVIPQSCTPAQGLVALYAQKGITEDQLLQAIENIPDAVQKYTVRIGFQRAITWERHSQSTQVMAQLLQLTEEDLDNLFEFAVTVSV